MKDYVPILQADDIDIPTTNIVNNHNDTALKYLFTTNVLLIIAIILITYLLTRRSL